MTTRTQTDDLHLLVDTLPPSLRDALNNLPQQDILEFVLDLGRPPQARYPDRAEYLSRQPVDRDDLDHVVKSVGVFGADNRAGIEGTLHRISAIRNRKGDIVGLTLRVGRAVFGTIDLIRDLVESGVGVLLLGRPGVGKTTKLREIARVLADDLGKRVIVIDTSNEIAGDGDIPHPAIGGARRMQVPHPDRQHDVMIEAVENHMPEVIVIDEIGTAADAAAARTIAERGVQLIGTAHGNTLENIVLNPTLADLVGGVQTVTLGDEEARLRRSQKTVSERKGPPTFDAVVEIADRDRVIVHADTGKAVDALLRGEAPRGAERMPEGEWTMPAAEKTEEEPAEPSAPVDRSGRIRIYPYAVSRDSVDRVIRSMGLDARSVGRPEQATLVIALRARAEDLRLRRILQATGLPLELVKKNSTAQIRRVVQNVFNVVHGADDPALQAAVRETEEAVKRVMNEAVEVELSPQPPAVRRLQQRIVARYRLLAESIDGEPHRRLVIRPS